MKRLFCIITLINVLFALNTVQAQETQQERRTPRFERGERTEEKESSLPELTVRAQDMNERLTQEIGNARWMRVIYREIDLTKEQNAPLYYPLRPINGNVNFFSTIFQALSENRVDAYEYLGDYEDFSDEHKISFNKDLLDRFYIFYEEVPGTKGDTSLIINESDIPSADVRSYYVKEAWYFDQNNSVFDIKILAICPILFSTGDLGEERRPMFWLPYENIRPYIRNNYIMTSNTNNAKTFTIDDYFRRRMYDGEIVKTENLMNHSLVEYCPTPDSLKREQGRIESQLVAFEQSLYLQPDTAVAEEVKTKSGKKSSSRASRASSTQEAKKMKTPKAEKSAPVRSIRGRR
ncbi:MAG: gliding motility protein GldN [Massilibacteroides sp.]|nr:gliding motility protein GldN [Massilibacteroides sp.]MDD3061975.1 gliding motility protein GldN [Massilibacteroides sp.]MDD4114030.1 gliding motility protein GldN [Massilibacteroides sp.]MDD4659308.1 gliding motility protein GldN [Massilibacteroides sp.]